jgi:hypothetical protein
MTDERNFDRLARAWLDLMPNEAPDRTVAAVLQAVETTPQVRLPWRRLPRRILNMNRPLFAGVATAVVLAVGGGLWLARSSPQPGGPSPSPSLSPSPSAASQSAASAPEELLYP